MLHIVADTDAIYNYINVYNIYIYIYSIIIYIHTIVYNILYELKQLNSQCSMSQGVA